MSTFDLVGTFAPKPFPKWLPLAGGLLAALTVATFVSRLPLVHTLSPAEILGLAIENVLEVFLVSAAVAWGLSAIRPRPSGADTCLLILRTSLDALWLAPLALFIREDSIWAMPMAAVFVTRAVTSFRSLRDEPGPIDREASPLFPLRTTLGAPQSSTFWEQAAGAGATLCAEAGAIAAFAGYSFSSAFLVGIASAVWTWSFTRGAQPNAGQSPSPQFSSRPLSMIALAIVITAAGLIRYLPHSFRIRGFGVPSPYHARQGSPRAKREGRSVVRKRSTVPVWLLTKATPALSCGPRNRRKPSWSPLRLFSERLCKPAVAARNLWKFPLTAFTGSSKRPTCIRPRLRVRRTAAPSY